MKNFGFTQFATALAACLFLAVLPVQAQELGVAAALAANDLPAPTEGAAPATPAPDTSVPVYQPNFLGAEVPLDSHRVSGYIIATLFTSAAVIGWIHYSDLVNGVTPDATLKYVHVGLVGAGEVFYLYNVITGTSMIPKTGRDSTIGTLHRAAFFVHVVLMAAQIAMGIVESNAVDRGDSVTIQNLGLAHAIVGTAIPTIILTSGILTNFPQLFGD